MLAWRLLHEPAFALAPSWLRAFFPAAPAFDRDPIALVLAALATGLSFVYLAAALAGAGRRVRLGLIFAGSTLLVMAPTLAFVGLSASTSRPYGQDGGVVQLPLAIDKLLHAQSPYGADYSDTILGRQARASSFWEPLGGNPILRHHAYLPGTHLVMLPGYALCRALFGFFDPRLVTLLFYGAAMIFAFRLPDRDDLRLCAAGLVAFNPLTWWQQVFGANDIVFVAMILGVVLLARSRRALGAAALLGLACATKQLAWPFAPFLLAALSGAGSLRDFFSAASLRRLVRTLGVAALGFVGVVAPVALLNPGAFYADIVKYNVGLPGGDNYPIGGTPGFGVANLLIAYGAVTSLKDYFPFAVFYLFLVPLGFLLLARQLRPGRVEASLVMGSAALFASVYLSRVAHSNYLIAVAILLPVGVLALRLPADLAVTPLALVALAVTVVDQEVFRATWDQAVAARVPEVLPALLRGLLPRPNPGLTVDPAGLVWSAAAAGLGLVILVAGVLGVRPALRRALGLSALLVCVVAPALLVMTIGARTGTERGLDAWVAQLPAAAARLQHFESPYAPPPPERPLARDAWSMSFRLDPPAEHRPERPLVPPGGPLLAALAGPLGVHDPRVPCLLALAAVLLLIARSHPEAAALAPGVALLLPFALGTVFGARSLLAVGGLAVVWGLLSRGRGGASAVVFGATVGLDHGAIVAAPLLACGHGDGRTGARRLLICGVAGYALVVFPVVAMGPAAAWAAVGRGGEAFPGFGLINLAAYAGRVPPPVSWLASAATAVVALLAVWAAARCRPQAALGLAACLALAGLFFAQAPAAGAVVLPLFLLGLMALSLPNGPRGDS